MRARARWREPPHSHETPRLQTPIVRLRQHFLSLSLVFSDSTNGLKGGAKEKNTKQNTRKASLPIKEWVSELRSHLRGRRRSTSPPGKVKKKSLRRRRRDMEKKKKTQNSPSLAALSLARTACTLIIKPTKPNASSQTSYTFLLSDLFPLFQNPLSSVPLSFSVSLCLWASSLFLLLLLLLLLCPLAVISGWWRSNSAHQLS